MPLLSKQVSPDAIPRYRPARARGGFTLIEVVLVLVLIAIISGISIPYFAGTFRGTKLRSAARTIERTSRYGRSMAIMREETLTMVLNHETMELYLGGEETGTTNAADGKLDQAVLKRLGYIKGEAGASDPGIAKEVRRNLPEELVVRDFKKDWMDEDQQYEDLYLIHFYPNGQCDWFVLEFEDRRGMAVKLENDPISGKVWSEFLQ